ncbi:hypothetical protein I6F35_20370 [Bradyrhizobium sp. BRP22]|uniref:hypothetical protein n=1 Tax=Bradyrhizobium sp. BRP22 TaxID=2793821 RepID=UPI001CD575DD|nr:hypothetical protein [Bradyrhizobium sp. BRP22]MCA1455534.1 hypothetical protein [Bradyrhizobium sp. BRP22]
MTRIFAALWSIAALAAASVAPSHAAPPTVVPSPGYDARLQESGGAASRAPTYYEPFMPAPKPVVPRRTKRTYHPR